MTTACNFSELFILDYDLVLNVCLIYYIPVSIHVALTADPSKIFKKNWQDIQSLHAEEGGGQKESHVKQEKDENLLN